MSEYEVILNKIGSFGPFQRRVFILVSMFETPAAWAMLIPIMLHATPDWHCPSVEWNDTDANFSKINHANASISQGECMADGGSCVGIQFTGDFTSIVSEWHLVCDMKVITSIITTIQMCGVLTGALITGQLADIFGRRRILFLAYLLMLVVSLCSAFSPSWQVLAAFRFVIGGLVGGVMVVNFVLPLEFVTPSWRTFCGCVGFWAVGLMTLALWGYLVKDWRLLVIGTAVTGIPMLSSWWFVPESPRWLLSKGRMEEAKILLVTMANYNNAEVPDQDYEKLFAYVEREKSVMSERKKYSYIDLFRSWRMTRTTLIVMYGWFVSSSVYYGLNFNTNNLAGNLYLNTFIAGLVEIPALAYVILVNNRIGRRWTISSLMLLAGCSCFGVLVIDIIGKKDSLRTLMIVLAMVGKSGISGGWAAVQVSSAENFPTIVRNIGIGACSMAARVGGIIAPQLVQLNSSSQTLPFIVFGCLAVLCGVLVLLLPETAGKPLTDNLHINSGETDVAAVENGGHFQAEEIPLNAV